MKAKITLLIIILAFIVTNGFTQEKSRKQIKEEKKIEVKKQTEAMINARQFVFTGRTALPTGYKSVNLTTITNYVRFYPDSIDSYMPFYGRAFSGVGYSNDDGLKFAGKPQEYTVTTGKKNYLVNAVVKSEKDTFRLSLTVSFEGSASLFITSNNRSSISYSGIISAPEEPEGKK
jgi:hypothetical protein